MKSFKGISASNGIAIGPAFFYGQRALKITRHQVKDSRGEFARFEAAKEVTRLQIERIYEKALVEYGEEQAEIFSAHLLILDDPELLDAVKNLILEQNINAEGALSEVSEQFIQMLEAIEDEYLSARAVDIRDVTSQLLRNLMGVEGNPPVALTAPAIIVAEDLTPSDTVLLDKKKVLGFCTARGGATSHTAILARSLGIPAVVGVGEQVLKLQTGASLILNGEAGEVIVNPDKSMIQKIQIQQEKLLDIKNKIDAVASQPAITLDGHQVEVAANIGNVDSVLESLQMGAEGVGLLRSEFLYLERSNLPTEEEQYLSYKKIADAFGDRPVILRTLDVGGDKDIPYIDMPEEANPFLGVRAIRLCLSRPDLFKPQLRAALRAGVGNNLKLMFPMVAAVHEVVQAREVLEECKKELVSEGVQIAENIEVGIMVEIPSAAVMADQFSKIVDFFSIGTNDLSQYLMAADRTNEHVSELASGFHPAVFRLVKQVIDAAHANGKWVGMCGELAGERLAIPIFLGLGLDEFSMNPPAIPYAKYLIRSIKFEKAQWIAEQVLQLGNGSEIQDFIIEQFSEVWLS